MKKGFGFILFVLTLSVLGVACTQESSSSVATDDVTSTVETPEDEATKPGEQIAEPVEETTGAETGSAPEETTIVEETTEVPEPKHIRILFQGDSITDSGRNYSDFYDLGSGYVKDTATMLTRDFPNVEFEFINVGISASRTEDLLDRMQKEAIALQPDIVSILIGINDVCHRYCNGRPYNTDEKIEENYRAILEQLRQQTNAKIIVIAPFFLDGFEEGIFSSVIATDSATLQQDTVRVAEIVRKLAEEYADVYIPMDEYFAEALSNQLKPRYYTDDSIHPNSRGHRLLANAYVDAAATLIDQILQSED